VCDDSGRLLLDESSEVLDAAVVQAEETFHDLRADYRQIAFEDNSVKTGQDTAKHVAILVDKAFHGVLLSDGLLANYHHAGRTPLLLGG
jgi:hypothetical protein